MFDGEELGLESNYARFSTSNLKWEDDEGFLASNLCKTLVLSNHSWWIHG